MDYLNAYNPAVNAVLSPLETPLINGLLRLFLILYGGLAAPHLPNSILQWFENVPFRIAFIALIVWTINHDPAISVLLAVSFFVTINTLNGKKPFEKFIVVPKN